MQIWKSNCWGKARRQKVKSQDLTPNPEGGTTAEGIHLGSMAGTVGIVHDCYVGIAISDDAISIEPNLPERFRRISLSIKYRGRWIAITVTRERFWVGLETQAKHGLVFDSNGVEYEVEPGEAVEVEL